MLINVSPTENAIIQAVRQGANIDLWLFDLPTNQAARDALAPFVATMPDATQSHYHLDDGTGVRQLSGEIAPGQYVNVRAFAEGRQPE
ncbi:hypothetical protein [Lacticaseibacillus mingshuiensis]|uniref:Uncharacterized protein n=1 Tax=Lacticaseibacillus mingshuiensis TaxID=2799574 RepID=A0ABW4CJ54_9LACO|nr:hypothetical protein [Lacticaseibacillus mingshuiensis]